MTNRRWPQLSAAKKMSRAVRAYQDLLDTAEWMRERMSRQLASWDLTIAQFNILEMIALEGGQYQTAIGQRFRCSRQNSTVVILRLEKMGLVRRKASHLARMHGKAGLGTRVVLVELTAEGKELVADVSPKHAKVVKAEMRALEGREQATLSRLCEKLKLGDPARFIREFKWTDPEEEEWERVVSES
jgi:MarR family 2-MHQ and catechol resistance regulon transcriptional repressor